MKKKFIHLLENLTEEVLIAMLVTGCAVSSLINKTEEKPKYIIQENYDFVGRKIKVERINYSEIKQGKLNGISEADIFLLNSATEYENLKEKKPNYLSEEKINEYLNKNYKNLNLPDYINENYVKALIKQESSNNSDAISSWGARGLLQLLESTWYDYETISYDEAFNPEKNINVGLRHLKWIDTYLRKNYPDYSQQTTQKKQDLISAVHNVGIGRLEKQNWDISQMPRETINHVERVRKKYDEMVLGGS